MSGAAGRNYQCSVCEKNPEQKKVWGCEGKTIMALPTFVDDDGTKYWSCPNKFIPDSVWCFIKIRLFYNDHPSSPFPSYDKISPRWLAAETILNKELLSFQREKHA